MEIIKDYINKFSDILIPFHPIMVIGGIYALKLHGMETRDTADLDMVVYNPPESFIKILQGKQEQSTDEYNTDIGDNRRRSFKLEREGLMVDFLIEYDVMKPHKLLTLLYEDRLWPVQSIDIVIAAKRKYGRDKDHQDLKTFADENFWWNDQPAKNEYL